MYQNINNEKTVFYDFFSFPHNPEDLFTLLYLIGKSESYEIYKAINNETREVFCIKIISLDKNIIDNENYQNNEKTSKLFFEKIKQETSLMKSIKKCENIAQYYGSFLSFKSRNIWLIYEYCPIGSLYDLMKLLNRDLTEQEISIIMNDILHGLIYIHQLNIIHKNIKITNILINEKGIAKLNNFSKSIQNLNNELLYLNNRNSEELTDTKYDIFLLGITCIEIYKGFKDKLFSRNILIDKLKNNNNSPQKIISKELNFNDKKISQEFFDFIEKCLEPKSYKRPTAFELSNHPFIKNNIKSDKTRFNNLIKSNIEKIENYKKENYIIKSKTFGAINIYSTIYSNIEDTHRSNTNNNRKQSSDNLSNLLNNINEVTNNNPIDDKLAEFRIKELKNPHEKIEYEKFSNKDLYSNIDNTGKNYITDNSFENSLNESAAFGKNEFDKKKEKYEIKKKSLLPKNLLKKENDNRIEINLEKGSNNIEKESEELDFKANLEHLKKFEEMMKSKLSNDSDESNQILKFLEESFDFDKNEERIKLEKKMPFSELKCNVIYLGSSIQRNNKQLNNTSAYSSKINVSKFGEINDFDYKDNNNFISDQKKSLLSFGNNALNDNFDKNNNIKEKNYKNERSTCYASLRSKLNKQNGGIKSCKQLFHIKKNNLEDKYIKMINNNNKSRNKDKKKNLDKNKKDNNLFLSERSKSPYLFKYLDKFDAEKENTIKRKKTNIIKINRVFTGFNNKK